MQPVTNMTNSETPIGGLKTLEYDALQLTKHDTTAQLPEHDTAKDAPERISAGDSPELSIGRDAPELTLVRTRANSTDTQRQMC